jgi:hypothetical protein
MSEFENDCSQENESQNFAFLMAKMEQAKTLTNVLNSLLPSNKKETTCTVHAEAGCLTFLVASRSKSTHSKVIMAAEDFDEYLCELDRTSHSRKIVFGLSLTTLLDCLLLCGGTTINGRIANEESSVSMRYDGREATFRLTLEESGIQTVCDLAVHEIDDYNDVHQDLTLAFKSSEEEANVILQSTALREAVLELTDTQGATEVRVEVVAPLQSSSSSSLHTNPKVNTLSLGSARHLSASCGGLILSTAGNAGECEMVLPADREELFISFKCSTPNLVMYYPITSFQLGMKALSVATESCLRINAEGVMALQHQVETGRGSETYVDFICVSLNKGIHITYSDDDGDNHDNDNGDAYSMRAHCLDSAHADGDHDCDQNLPFNVSQNQHHNMFGGGSASIPSASADVRDPFSAPFASARSE